MENIVNTVQNHGALPMDYEELQLTDRLGIPEETDRTDEISSDAVSDKQAAMTHVYNHVRTPELRRSGTRILMGLTALCGAVSGAVIAFSGSADPDAFHKLSASLAGEFGGLAVHSVIIGAAFLAAELLLGFFALGDWLVWVLPLCYAMGTVLKVTATGTVVLLPSAAAGICAVTFAAATSAAFSQTLLRLSKGGTVYLDSSPQKNYILAFLGYTVIIAAAAIYEGAALNWT